MSITPERIAELRALAERATPGPWDNIYEPGKHIVIGASNPTPRGICVIPNDASDEPRKRVNAAYIVAAANALPALLDEVERLQVIERAYMDAAPLLAIHGFGGTSIEQLRNPREDE